MPGDF